MVFSVAFKGLKKVKRGEGGEKNINGGPIFVALTHDTSNFLPSFRMRRIIFFCLCVFVCLEIDDQLLDKERCRNRVSDVLYPKTGPAKKEIRSQPQSRNLFFLLWPRDFW